MVLLTSFQYRWQKEGKHLRPMISNSCNGMLLLRLGRCIFLLNPTTHYIDKVLTLGEWYYNLRSTEDVKMGFCYDESIGDYKAVIFVTYANTLVKVASMKERKWAEFHVAMYFHDISVRPYVNGRLHSTVCIFRDSYDRVIAHNTILYFNPIKNVFEEVACPQPKSGDENEILGLGVLEDCLCIARRIGKDKDRWDLEVLKMKEYGVAESWTSLFVLKNLEVNRYRGRMIMSPLLKTEDGDILLIDSYGRIWRYNLAEKSCTQFLLKGITRRIAAVTFVESLCSPNRPLGRRDVREGYWRKQWFFK